MHVEVHEIYSSTQSTCNIHKIVKWCVPPGIILFMYTCTHAMYSFCCHGRYVLSGNAGTLARFLQSQLPIRFARRVEDILKLPHVVVSNQHIGSSPPWCIFRAPNPKARDVWCQGQSMGFLLGSLLEYVSAKGRLRSRFSMFLGLLVPVSCFIGFWWPEGKTNYDAWRWSILLKCWK